MFQAQATAIFDDVVQTFLNRTRVGVEGKRTQTGWMPSHSIERISPPPTARSFEVGGLISDEPGGNCGFGHQLSLPFSCMHTGKRLIIFVQTDKAAAALVLILLLLIIAPYHQVPGGTLVFWIVQVRVSGMYHNAPDILCTRYFFLA